MTLMSEVVAELQASGSTLRVSNFGASNFSWCLRSASCPGASSTAYICTGNERSKSSPFLVNYSDSSVRPCLLVHHRQLHTSNARYCCCARGSYACCRRDSAVQVRQRNDRALLNTLTNTCQTRVSCDEECHRVVHVGNARGHHLHLRVCHHVLAWPLHCRTFNIHFQHWWCITNVVNQTCSLFIWLLSIGFSLLFVYVDLLYRYAASPANYVADCRSLFVKTIRVHRIFKKNLLLKVWTNNDLGKAMAVFLSIDVVRNNHLPCKTSLTYKYE